LASRLVVGRKRDGRCVYDVKAKQELIFACREPGVSIARLARDCGINANQLSAWVRQSERKALKGVALISSSGTAASAFVPVHIEESAPSPAPSVMQVSLQARLPNGVVVDLQRCDMRQVGDMLEALGRLRCSASTKG